MPPVWVPEAQPYDADENLCDFPNVLFTELVLATLGCGSVKENQITIRQRLATTIPLQSSPTQVLDYLDRQKIEHSQYIRDAAEGNSIKAISRDGSNWSVVKTNYSVVFRFDDHDRLVAYDVRPGNTGP